MSDEHTSTTVAQDRPVSSLRILIALGVLLTGVYTALAVLSLQFGPDSQSVDRPILTFLGLLGIAFILYLGSIRAALNTKEGRPLLATILLTAIVMRGVSLVSWPILEIDIYRYIWDGAVVQEGVSPYGYSPEQVLAGKTQSTTPDDLRELLELRDSNESLRTILSRIHYAELPTIYPPVSQAIFALSVLMTPDGSSVLAHLLTMKVVLVLFDLATVLVVIGLLHMAKRHLGWAVAYGWCPLVIKEIANTGHLDSVAVFFTTLALFLALRPLARGTRVGTGRVSILSSSAMLALAVGAKLYPIVLAPVVFWIWSRTQRWQWTVFAGVVFLGLSVCIVWPLRPLDDAERSGDTDITSANGMFIPPPTDTAEIAPRDPSGGLKAFLKRWEMNDFLFLLVVENLKPMDGIEPARRAWFSIMPESCRSSMLALPRHWLSTTDSEAAFVLTRILTGSVFMMIVVVLLVQARSANDPAVWMRVAFLTVAWFWLLSPTQNPWYWIWALPLVAFARSRAWLAVSGLSLLYYVRFWLVYHWPDEPLPGTRYAGAATFDFIVTWIEFAPWLLCLAWMASRARANAPRTQRLRGGTSSVFAEADPQLVRLLVTRPEPRSPSA